MKGLNVPSRHLQSRGGAAQREVPIITTTAGPVRGEREHDVLAFRGVPYGASTAGAARFRPARAPRRWIEPRDCTTLGPICPQRNATSNAEFATFLFGGDAASLPQSEDCLNLNVWTPATDRRRRGVLVWVHGGGYAFGMGTGATADAATNGAALASDQDIVVVTLNHRLGVLGFLHLVDVLGTEWHSTSNVGLLDIVAALRWVSDNIASFGGDARNVTIVGHSGGAGKVHALLAMPEAQGLFARAVLQSGNANQVATGDEATFASRQVLAQLNCKPDAESLQRVPINALLEAQSMFSSRSDALQPVVDGVRLPLQPLEAVASGRAADVPLIVGWTRDEWRLFATIERELTEDGLWERLRAAYGEHGAAMYTAYRSAHPQASPGELLVHITGDVTVRQAALRLAEARLDGGTAPVWTYAFHYESSALGGWLGATHALEISFVFGTVERVPLTGSDPARLDVADATSSAWGSFVRTGRPVAAGCHSWPPYERLRRASMVFDVESRIVEDLGGRQRQAWAGATT